jgi:uncharacterized protein
VKPTICTYLGIEFNPFSPRLEDIDIEDIAHALSQIPRFGGHTRRFYSVAQHSWEVSLLCPRANAGYGLLHDAAEAYLLDVPSPIKQQMLFVVPGNVSNPVTFKDVEQNLLGWIFERFGLDRQHAYDLPLTVKKADYSAYQHERAGLLPETTWYPTAVPPREIHCLPPDEAKALFLRRFNQLADQGHIRRPS